MINRDQLVQYCDNYLAVNEIADYAPNGLQVEGKPEIRKIITGVTACQALLDKAVEKQVDAVLVHHGYFWKGELPQVVGMKQRRLQTLLKHNINLLGYHLPLDVHLEVGNNVRLAGLMDWHIIGELDTHSVPNIGLVGELAKPLTVAALSKQLEDKLKRAPLAISGGKHQIKTLAWCTGAAQDFIDYAADAGVDAYVTGEVSERTVHIARERGIHFFAAGHHATERGGVQALGRHLQEEFGVVVEFVDVANPV